MTANRISGESISSEYHDLIYLVNDIKKIIESKYSDDLKIIDSNKNITYFNIKLSKEFPKELDNIIIEELLDGNRISEYWKNYGTYILFEKPLNNFYKNVKEPLFYRDVDDRHYWKNEIRYKDSDYAIAGKFE